MRHQATPVLVRFRHKAGLFRSIALALTDSRLCLLAHDHRLEIVQRHLCFRRRLPQQAGDLLGGDHLLLNDLLGHLGGFQPGAIGLLLALLLLGDILEEAHDDILIFHIYQRLPGDHR